MKYHYEYSTHSCHHRILVHRQGSNTDALKRNSHVVFSEILFHFRYNAMISHLHLMHGFNTLMA